MQSASSHTLILASASPRRRELVGRLGIPYSIEPADVDEEGIEAAFTGDPLDLAPHLAAIKARTIGERHGDDVLVLAADTTVVLDGSILGKPRDAEEAWAMLRRLRGRTHIVSTGTALWYHDQMTIDAGRTPVEMRDYTDEEIARYIATGDPFDKAGSYAIQHPEFQPVARINGCATNVIGLPLCLVAAQMRMLGVSVAPAVGSPCPWDTRCTVSSAR